MTGCVERCCGDVELPRYRNEIAAVISGSLFFTGWWFMIYAAAAYPSNEMMPHAVHTCGVVATVAFILVNMVSNEQVRGNSYNTEGGCLGTPGARICFLLAFILLFSSLIASMWILFGLYVDQKIANTVTPGVCVFMQNFLILLAAFVFKFGRVEENQ